jgi:hypothetical protein
MNILFVSFKEKKDKKKIYKQEEKQGNLNAKAQINNLTIFY